MNADDPTPIAADELERPGRKTRGVAMNHDPFLISAYIGVGSSAFIGVNRLSPRDARRPGKT
jgi:hypothetical protein